MVKLIVLGLQINRSAQNTARFFWSAENLDLNLDIAWTERVVSKISKNILFSEISSNVFKSRSSVHFPGKIKEVCMFFVYKFIAQTSSLYRFYVFY